MQVFCYYKNQTHSVLQYHIGLYKASTFASALTRSFSSLQRVLKAVIMSCSVLQGGGLHASLFLDGIVLLHLFYDILKLFQ